MKTFEQYLKEYHGGDLPLTVKDIPLGTEVELTDGEQRYWNNNYGIELKKISFSKDLKYFSGKTIEVSKTEWSDDWYGGNASSRHNMLYLHKSWLDFSKIKSAIVKRINVGTIVKLDDRAQKWWKENGSVITQWEFRPYYKKWIGKKLDNIEKTLWSNDWYVYYGGTNDGYNYFHKSWLNFDIEQELDLE